jgi:hypothetical protein
MTTERAPTTALPPMVAPLLAVVFALGQKLRLITMGVLEGSNF